MTYNLERREEGVLLQQNGPVLLPYLERGARGGSRGRINRLVHDAAKGGTGYDTWALPCPRPTRRGLLRCALLCAGSMLDRRRKAACGGDGTRPRNAPTWRRSKRSEMDGWDLFTVGAPLAESVSWIPALPGENRSLIT